MDDTTRTVARSVELFSALSDSELEAVLSMADALEFADGDLVVREGDVDTDAYLIIEGEVRISQRTGSGDAKTLAMLPSRTMFGEMALTAAMPRTADAYAVGPTKVLRLQQANLFALLDSKQPSALAKLLLALFEMVGPRVQQTNTELVTLYAAGRLMGQERDIEQLLPKMLGLLVSATHAKTGAVLLYNEGSQTLTGAAAYGYPDDENWQEWVEPYGQGGASKALENGETLMVEDWNAEPRTKDLTVTGYERVTSLLVPLFNTDEPLGVFVLGDKMNEIGEFVPFANADRILVEGIASMTAAGIANAQHAAELMEKEKLQRKYIGQ